MMQSLEEKYFVYQDDNIIAAVPPFARYAYEIWIIPKKQRAGPWQFNENEIKSFANCLCKKLLRGYDSFPGEKMSVYNGFTCSSKFRRRNYFTFMLNSIPPFV